ncbi:MAG TPA: isoprenylcysteine carboxylmethyltransferase family protein [Alphaproteobacteria bacterium]|nr:isoprenylcysteine carboxylmethyltransferase family protein [Alphaproteobacteria bacterium]
MKVFGGYTWQGWLAGRAVPLVFFAMFLVAGGLALPREVALLAREGISFYPALEVLRRGLMVGFWLLVVAAYLTRRQAVARAHGFWERIFPLLVMFTAPIGVWWLGRAGMPHRVELIGVAFLLTLLGYGTSLWALWHLRSSFAIMAEARRAVTSGPYHYVRHPLYLGEALTLLGLCLMIGTAIALLFWAGFTALQLTRARIEEAKLSSQFDGYRAYRQRTRFILPGLY